MSRVMRKLAFCISENKVADQLGSNCAADQRLCFHNTSIVQSLYFLNPKFQASSHLHCTAWFVSDLVGNPEDRFSGDTAHMGLIHVCLPLSIYTFKHEYL